MRKGGGKNETKANARRAEEAKKRADLARTAIRNLESIPVNQRPEEYAGEIKRQRGILSKALSKQRSSETHSRKSKGGGK
ncbi:MAG TPA: hypothetical protein VF865_20540 [Acidobacteriaceae bacterium]